MYSKKFIMKFVFLFLFCIFINQDCESLGLGTKIFAIDRDIYDSIRQLSPGHGNKLLENLIMYTKNVKLLLKTIKKPKKRTIQVVACYCNNGCPRFLRLKMPSREMFRSTFHWVDDEYSQFIGYINQSQHLKEDVYQIYEREKINYKIKDD